MDLNQFLNQANDAQLLQNLSAPVQIALLLGAFALIPAALMTLTCFTRCIIVLSFVRQGLASQSIPPNMVLIGLSMFLTLFIMQPTLDEIGQKAVTPYMTKQISGIDAIRAGANSLQKFMLRQTRKQDIALFLQLSGKPTLEEPEQTPFVVLVPAFVISELKTAFIMGFGIYLPF